MANAAPQIEDISSPSRISTQQFFSSETMQYVVAVQNIEEMPENTPFTSFCPALLLERWQKKVCDKLIAKKEEENIGLFDTRKTLERINQRLARNHQKQKDAKKTRGCFYFLFSARRNAYNEKIQPLKEKERRLKERQLRYSAILKNMQQDICLLEKQTQKLQKVTTDKAIQKACTSVEKELSKLRFREERYKARERLRDELNHFKEMMMLEGSHAEQTAENAFIEQQENEAKQAKHTYKASNFVINCVKADAACNFNLSQLDKLAEKRAKVKEFEDFFEDKVRWYRRRPEHEKLERIDIDMLHAKINRAEQSVQKQLQNAQVIKALFDSKKTIFKELTDFLANLEKLPDAQKNSEYQQKKQEIEKYLQDFEKGKQSALMPVLQFTPRASTPEDQPSTGSLSLPTGLPPIVFS